MREDLKAETIAAAEQFFEEGKNGVLLVEVDRFPHRHVRLEAHVAVAADKIGECLLKWIQAFMDQEETPHAFKCLACEHTFADIPDTFVYTKPGIGAGSMCLSGICKDCETKTDLDLCKAAMEFFADDPKDVELKVMQKWPVSSQFSKPN